MLSEAIELLLETGKGNGATIIGAVPNEPEHVYYLRQADGTLQRVEGAPKPLKASAYSVGALVDAAELLDGTLTVWYSRHEVVLVGGKDRRQLVQFRPTLSPQIQLLDNHVKQGVRYSQRDLLNLLKVALADCHDGTLQEVIRAVKFEVLQQGQAEVRQGKASLGKQLTAQLSGTAEIAEVVSFRVPVFTACLQQRRYEVRVSLEVEPESQTFKLQTFPLDVERALQWAEADLAELIAKELNEEAVEATVVYGQPR